MQVSYGLSDDRIDVFSNFYRTVPSIVTLNQARVYLLARFKWYRIGILGSHHSNYNYVRAYVLNTSRNPFIICRVCIYLYKLYMHACQTY